MLRLRSDAIAESVESTVLCVVCLLATIADGSIDPHFIAWRRRCKSRCCGLDAEQQQSFALEYAK